MQRSYVLHLSIGPLHLGAADVDYIPIRVSPYVSAIGLLTCESTIMGQRGPQTHRFSSWICFGQDFQQTGQLLHQAPRCTCLTFNHLTESLELFICNSMLILRQDHVVIIR